MNRIPGGARINLTALVALTALGGCDAGHDGTIGPIGGRGPEGREGPPGRIGTVGPNGPTGPAGPAGIPGVIQGGTGPVGPRGPAGPAGAVGAAGLRGNMGATGPAGPVGARGAVGAAGIGLHKRATFNAPISAAAGVAQELATISFTPTVSGTALVKSRGFCGVTGGVAANYADLAAGVDLATAFTAASPSDSVSLGLPANFPAIQTELPFTTETTLPVTANVAATVVLAVRRSTDQFVGCAGSFQVDVSGTML